MFFRYSQNNSGGYYIAEDSVAGVGRVIVVEAENAAQSNERFESIRQAYGEDSFDAYCECCGYRWYNQYDGNGTEHPRKEQGAYVHYLDGRIEKF